MADKRFVEPSAVDPLYPRHVQEVAARYDRALETAGGSHAVVFSGAPRLIFLDDYHYPFKANPHFVAWLPVTTMPFCYIVYSPGEKPILIYFQEQDYWHLPPANPDAAWANEFDVRIVNSLQEIDRHLPAVRENCILIGEIDDPSHAFNIDRINPTSAMHILHYGRSAKTDYEIACMRAASVRAAHGHRAAEAAFRDGRSEYEIHLEYCRATEHTETELPYGNIIALNEHGAVLHYQHQDRELPTPPRSFLIDAGASVAGYAADITRTYSYREDEFQDLIERFDALHRELVADVADGVDFAKLHLAAHRKIAALLVEFGLATGSVDALIETDVTAAFYPHGLGHYLGIQVHDVGGCMADESGTVIDRPSGHPYLRLTRVLRVDEVLTIEPGLYVIDMLQKDLKGTPGYDLIEQEKVDWLRSYGGIRIEDNVRVLPNGCENLTRDAFAAV